MDAVAGADVVLLRDGSHNLVVARLAGHMPLDIGNGEDIFELAGAYSVTSDGTTLASIIGTDEHRLDGTPHDHGWGALGLPDGLNTRVTPVRERAAADDVATAAASEGYRQFASNRRLSLSPGDRVTSGSVTGLVVAVDRRTQEVEVRIDDSVTRTFGFDAVPGLEQER